MGRLLIFPILLACALSVLFGVGGYSFFSSHLRNPDRELRTDIAQQKHLADCYRVGCAEYHKSQVLGCAWRLVILEETHTADDADAATSDCDALGEKEKQTAAITKENLWNRLHPKRRPH
jgi:hypothetical protein